MNENTNTMPPEEQAENDRDARAEELEMELLIGITKAWQKISMENGALVMEQLTLVTTV